jgi:hypothetical protein
MLKKFAFPLTLAGLWTAYAGSACANENGSWATTFWAGPLASLQGTEQFPASGAIADLGALDPSFADDPATTDINRLSFQDVFRSGETLGAELAYRTGLGFEPFARLSFSRLGGEEMPIGTISSAAFAKPAPVTANFDAARSSSLTLGGRYFFSDAGALHPFIAGYVGADHLDALHADVAVVPLGRRFDRQTVMSNNTRFLAGVQGGVSYSLSPSADLRFAIGAERLSAEQLESKFLAPLGIDDIKVNERRWSIPAEIGVNYRF